MLLVKIIKHLLLNISTTFDATITFDYHFGGHFYTLYVYYHKFRISNGPGPVHKRKKTRRVLAHIHIVRVVGPLYVSAALQIGLTRHDSTVRKSDKKSRYILYLKKGWPHILKTKQK